MQLKDEINNQEIIVYRGAYGTANSVPVHDLVVGDVIQLTEGDRVPADCIVLDEMSLEIDQSIYSKKGDQKRVKKGESQLMQNEDGDLEDNHKSNPDITLLSDTKVMKGECRAIVLAVGKHTLLSRSRKKDHLEIKEDLTDLEQKLDKVSVNIGYYAEYAMIACLLTQILYVCMLVMISEDEKKTIMSSYTLLRMLKVGIIAIVILMVAIPEGLSLAVSVAMALSISKMKKDKILIKNVEAVQKCAFLHDICVSKTGTLTEGELHVASLQLLNFEEVHDNDSVENPAFFN